MIKYNKLRAKLQNNEIINLLFVSPNYGNTYPYSIVETNYFDKKRFKCDVKLITNDDIPAIINLFMMEDKYDCIVNLCDGYIDNKNNIPGVNFINELEKYQIPYTGSDARVFSLTKFDLGYCDDAPPSIHYSFYLKNKSCIDNLKFPLFVKPNNLGCSEFIDNDSVINSKCELETKLNLMTKFTTDIIIQEYIDGNEYTVLVFTDKRGEIICLNPIQIKFTNSNAKYLTNKIKLEEFDNIIYDFNVENAVMTKIKNICVNAYKKMDLNSYIRIDVRSDKIIDINPYPEIFGPEDEEDMNDVIIRKFYDFNDFLIDMLCDTVRRHSF